MRRIGIRLATLFMLLYPMSPAAAADEAIYLERVKPVLRERCFACHGALKQEAGLRLDTAALMRQGGDSGPSLTAGDPGDSVILDRITADDELERMPPEGKPLTAEEIRAVREWIAAGAEAPENEQPESDPRQHWAFQPPRSAKLSRPKVGDADNVIDQLLEVGRREQGLKAGPAVSRSLLLRRVYLDLIGVPPTRDQLHRFLADDSPDAFEREVDRLLASPRYGERWGRHWMDVWRYTDWYGLGKQLRNSQKHIWRWRDWIVESLNRDVGYDEMVRLMLAADELKPEDRGALRATGFLARNYYLFNRTTWLDSTLEHTAKSFLGLTVNCAKCHDHKYDAISQHDYYALRAVFEPHQVRLDPVAGETDLEKDGLPRVFDAHPEAKTYLHIRGDAKNVDKSAPIEPGVLEVVLADRFKPQSISLPPTAARPELLPFVRRDQLAAAERAIATAQRHLEKVSDQLAKQSAEVAANKPTEDGLIKSPSAQASKPFADESFDQPPSSADWTFGPGQWKYEDGHLLQLQDGATRKNLVSTRNHPRDIYAKLKFTTIGGAKWRSVGLVFDSHDNDESMIYMSAVQPGSKLQVYHKVAGKDSYPAEGRVSRAVKLNTPYQLEIFIRDRLLNVSIDGKHALAYRMPHARRPGKIHMVAFDAKVRFDHLLIRELGAEKKLVQAKGGGNGLTLAQLRAEKSAAQARLAAAKLYPAAIEASLAAERLQFESGDDAAIVRQAVDAHLAWQQAKAEAELAAAELENDVKKKAAAVRAARAKLDQLKKQRDDGSGKRLRLQVALKALEGPDEKDASRRQPFPTTSTGRRSALAEWITDANNPLTARVAVNQVWMRHFGQPLVDPVDDFGRRTAPPVQLALLDHLAAKFMAGEWRFKELHRLIVTSQVYRLATATNGNVEALAADSTNQYYWRRLPNRMESELVRDSLIHLANRIDWRIGGASLPPKQGTAASGRRSLYFTHSRDDQHEFLSMFDHADILRCYRRSESIVPQQALTLANSRLSLEAARGIAASMKAAGDWPDHSPAFVDIAFETVLTRSPSESERAICLEVLDQLRSAAPTQDADARELRARANLIHALINHNDFITIR